MFKKLVFLALLTSPFAANAQNSPEANFQVIVQSEIIISNDAGIVRACGLRSNDWTDTVLGVAITGIKNVSQNLWGTTETAKAEQDTAISQMISGYHAGLTAGPADCQAFINNGTAEQMDHMLHELGVD